MKSPGLKICGMRDPDNIREVLEIKPDFIGFIFYSGSPRYAGDVLRPETLETIPAEIKKVGVFVDEPMEAVLQIAGQYRLDMLQLHGNEDPVYCAALKQNNYGIIKSVMIGDGFKYRTMEPYLGSIDYFLFDTKGMLHGGSGISFNWHILDEYPFEAPFFLSGGLSLENIEQVYELRSKYLKVIDVNSRFESSPGYKDIYKLRLLRDKLMEKKSENYDY